MQVPHDQTSEPNADRIKGDWHALIDTTSAAAVATSATWASLRAALKTQTPPPVAWESALSAAGHSRESWQAFMLQWLVEQSEWAHATRVWLALQRSAAGRAALAAADALGVYAPSGWTALAQTLAQWRSAHLREVLRPLREEHGPRAVFRIERALAGYLGEASVFSSDPRQRPTLMYVPGLAAEGFLDAQRHANTRALVDAFPIIRQEYLDALTQRDAFEPFLGTDRPIGSEYVSGGRDAAWDARFFYRHGQRHPQAAERCPQTAAVLDSLDLCRISGQAPEICFSLLNPHTRIEPHHGVTNARVVMHLPLVVPPGCFLELSHLGRHHWREGEVLVFDDTYEHCAENPSDAPRGILLMDAWHPDLTAVERLAFTQVIEGITRLEKVRLDA